jgi:hypothetical protein
MRSRLTLVVLCSISSALGAEATKSSAISLNPVALRFAQELIKQGRVVLDRKGAWTLDQPSIAQKNEFVRLHGFEEYGKWHLGIDLRHSSRGKAHYKFPFGDFAVLHRCGLLAVKARAHEYGYAGIEAAADQLLTEIEIKQPTR